MLPPLPLTIDIETKAVLRKTVAARSALAELKGVITSIPNQNILLQTLALSEARESSAIENIISTFDEVTKAAYSLNNLQHLPPKRYTSMPMH